MKYILLIILLIMIMCSCGTKEPHFTDGWYHRSTQYKWDGDTTQWYYTKNDSIMTVYTLNGGQPVKIVKSRAIPIILKN